VENQFLEVAIKRQECPALSYREGQHFSIGNSGVVLANMPDIPTRLP